MKSEVEISVLAIAGARIVRRDIIVGGEMLWGKLSKEVVRSRL